MKGVEYINLLAVVLTAGWASAFLTQLIKRVAWASYVKLVLAVVVAGLVGLATAWLTGDATRFLELWRTGGVTAAEVLALGALIFTAAQVWYHKFFSDQEWAQKLGAWGGKPN